LGRGAWLSICAMTFKNQKKKKKKPHLLMTAGKSLKVWIRLESLNGSFFST
jgi:hypothetical protein